MKNRTRLSFRVYCKTLAYVYQLESQAMKSKEKSPVIILNGENISKTQNNIKSLIPYKNTTKIMKTQPR